MIIGFRTKITILNEILGRFPIEVHSKIRSEVEYTIDFSYRELNATVVSEEETGAPNHDARFGRRQAITEDLVTDIILQVNRNTPQNPVRTLIVHDVIPEGTECYIIKIDIGVTDPGEGRDNFQCNDASDAEDFFCDNTVCILDDDG